MAITIPSNPQPLHMFFRLRQQQQTGCIGEPNPSQPEFHIELHVRLQFQLNYQLDDEQVINVDQAEAPTIVRTLSLDPQLFLDTNRLRQTVSQMLSQVKIQGRRQRSMVERISSFAWEMMNSESNMGRKKLSMLVEILVLQEFLYNEAEAIAGVMMGSMEEDEGMGYGVIPASRSSVDALKKVRFEGGDSMDDCMICLEEFKVGSQLTSMPCFHVFHHNCIARWLGTSHFCPICRFEMPI